MNKDRDEIKETKTLLTVAQRKQLFARHYVCREDDMEVIDLNFAKAVEQEVLASPQVQALLDALEESNSLLVACAHEKRPWREIESQLGMNRDALIEMGRHAQ